MKIAACSFHGRRRRAPSLKTPTKGRECNATWRSLQTPSPETQTGRRTGFRSSRHMNHSILQRAPSTTNVYLYPRGPKSLNSQPPSADPTMCAHFNHICTCTSLRRTNHVDRSQEDTATRLCVRVWVAQRCCVLYLPRIYIFIWYNRRQTHGSDVHSWVQQEIVGS